MLPSSELARLIRRLDESFDWLEAIHTDLDNCRYQLKRTPPRDPEYSNLRCDYLRTEIEWDEAFTKFLKLAAQAATAIEQDIDSSQVPVNPIRPQWPR